MLIGHPPCTYMTVTANKWLKDQPEIKSGKLVGEKRRQAKKEAEEFFIALWNCGIPKIALENPVGSINGIIPPTQIVQPYYFGDEARKTTCLWLKGLPKLVHIKQDDLFATKTHVGQGEILPSGIPAWYGMLSQKEDRTKIRSKTFPGLAQAMANQWG